MRLALKARNTTIGNSGFRPPHPILTRFQRAKRFFYDIPRACTLALGYKYFTPESFRGRRYAVLLGFALCYSRSYSCPFAVPFTAKPEIFWRGPEAVTESDFSSRTEINFGQSAQGRGTVRDGGLNGQKVTSEARDRRTFLIPGGKWSQIPHHFLTLSVLLEFCSVRTAQLTSSDEALWALLTKPSIPF